VFLPWRVEDIRGGGEGQGSFCGEGEAAYTTV
jgi:hypothetical protein